MRQAQSIRASKIRRNDSMKKTFSIVLALIMCIGVLASCGEEPAPANTGNENKPAENKNDDSSNDSASSADSDVIKIGVFEPFTGKEAAGGEQTFEGIELANEEVNEVLGKKVVLVKVDNKSEQVEAGNAAQRLVDKEKVNAVIGSYSSGLSMAGGPAFKEGKIPAVGCSPTNPLVTQGNEWYFRVCFIDPFQGAVMANFAMDSLEAKTAAIIKDLSNDYSVGLCNFFKDTFTKANGDDSIVMEVDYKTDDTDFTAHLSNVKEAEPDVIFAPGNYNTCALMIKQAREAGIETPFLGGDTWEAPEFIDIAGDAVNEGVYFATHFSSANPVNDKSKAYLDSFKNKFNKDSSAFAALGYDAYMVIIDCIERAGSAEPEKIREELTKTKDFVGATGTITLDENGDAVKDAVINTVENGEFVFLQTVKP